MITFAELGKCLIIELCWTIYTNDLSPEITAELAANGTRRRWLELHEHQVDVVLVKFKRWG